MAQNSTQTLIKGIDNFRTERFESLLGILNENKPLTNNSYLKDNNTLNLHNSTLKQTELIEIAKAANGHPAITRIILDGNNITDETAIAFADLAKENPNIKNISIGDQNPAMTAVGAKTLKNALPENNNKHTQQILKEKMLNKPITQKIVRTEMDELLKKNIQRLALDRTNTRWQR